MTKPKLLLVSHVLPFPGDSGQQQRVAYMLQAVREFFHVTFLAIAEGDASQTREKLSRLSDEVILLPSRYSRSKLSKAWHGVLGKIYSWRTGLKLSNYIISRLEFSPARMREVLQSVSCDCVLYEYFHAFESVSVFRERKIPCALDMHNILWQSHAQRLSEKSGLPDWWRQRQLSKYQHQEEASWKTFDGVVAINSAEQQYVAKKIPSSVKLFYAPMGIDLRHWPYTWNPAQPMRVAYYGGLGSSHNQEAALRCHRQIMPEIWRAFPDAELWLVGSKPPEQLRALTRDPRVKVTGFVQDVQKVLCHMTAVLCPWVGTYGFRSRLVEVMALGVPVVATPQAVDGMDLENEKGLLLGNEDAELARQTLRLLQDANFAKAQSHLARQQMETLYDVGSTYGRFAREFFNWWSAYPKASK